VLRSRLVGPDQRAEQKHAGGAAVEPERFQAAAKVRQVVSWTV
jgi:hypothetical protein